MHTSKGIMSLAAALALTGLADSAVEIPLPSGYTRLEYVQGDGATARLTAAFPDSRSVRPYATTRSLAPYADNIEMDFAFADTNATQCLWCGTYVASTPNYSVLTWVPVNGFRYDYAAQKTDVFFGSDCAEAMRLTVVATNNFAGLVGGDGTERTKASNFTAGSKVLQLFASYNSGNNDGTVNNSANFSTMKLYGFKVRNPTGASNSPVGLVCDLVPVLDPAGKAGFYDVTRQCLIRCYGTFVAGPATSPFRIAEIERQYVDGTSAATPHPAVTDPSSGLLLTEGTDYTLSWANNTRSTRLATLTVTGKSGTAYAGKSMTVTFEVQPGVPFRTMTVTANRKSGAITSFDLTFGAAPAATPLYVAYGPTDGGATTNGWAHLDKLSDVPAGVQALNVPITVIPDWGSENVKFARFFLKPGDLFVGYQCLYSNTRWWYVTECCLTSEDTVDMDFRVHSASRYGGHWVGCYDRESPKARLCTAYAGGNQMRTYFGTSATGCSYDQKTTGSTSIYYGRHNMRFGATGYTIYTNEALYASYNYEYPGAAFVCNEPMTFWYATNYVPQSGYNYERGDLYYVTVLRDGAVNRTLYPCATNGVCCFYDTATQRFVSPRAGSGSDGYGVSSDDHGPVSESIPYIESDYPEAVQLHPVMTNLVSGRIEGTIRRLGRNATSADLYFAYAPKGEALPELTLVQSGLQAGDAVCGLFSGLETGVEYDYVINVKNDLGVWLNEAVTGSFVARSTHTWTGAAGTEDWFDTANWEFGLPYADSCAVIPSEASVMLTNTPNNLFALNVAGTLMTSNWLTRVMAETVTIPSGGKVTCAGPFTDDTEMSNRVWIACRDLTIDAGGAIDVNDKGYDGGREMRTRGYGPGATDANGASGASYGGFGGGSAVSRPAPCGNPADPCDPGSGGKGGASNIGTAGGGAVKIDATGRVTVNGSILASATVYRSGTYNGLGSGGAISIGCASFAGTGGVLKADAAVSQMAVGAQGAYPGGGGRIAIRTSAQTAGLVSGVKISAQAGLCSQTLENEQDSARSHADIGTLYFNDPWYVPLIGKSLTGQIVNVDVLALDELEMASGHVRFPAEGFKLTVAGDLTVTGLTARLELGGAVVTNRVLDYSLYCGTTPSELSVGGDMTIGEGGRFDVYSAETNGLGSVGAKVSVAGTLTVGAASKLTAGCDEVNGGAPVFSVSNLVVEATGVFTADGRGFAGGRTPTVSSDPRRKGKGPGGGDCIGYTGQVSGSKYIGGGYGGIGGWSEDGGSTSGLSYGDEWHPTLPGSGGGGRNWKSNGGAGGGVIDVTATGAIRVDGTVSANGSNFYMLDPNVGGGSGGAIYLKARTFSGAATGVIVADGQSRSKVYNGGAGGGGRIAIWTGELPYDGRLMGSRVRRQTVPFVMRDGSTFSGAVSAAGGTNSAEESDDADGTNGTVRFVRIGRPVGLFIRFR